MKRHYYSLKPLFVLFICSFGILFLFFQMLNQSYQRKMNGSINRLTHTNQILSELGNAIQSGQNALLSYSQNRQEECFSVYRMQTELIFESTGILQKDFTDSKDCLLYSRVVYQVNEAQRDFVTEYLYPYSGSQESFEHLRSIRLIFSEMNEAYAKLLNSYLDFSNEKRTFLQRDFQKFKNIQFVIWGLVTVCYVIICFITFRNILEKSEAEKELLHQKELLNEAHCQMLQMQINPHFLFNTLNLIVHTIQSGETKTAARLVKATADLLRSSLSITQVEIPLQKELELLKLYLTIFQERYQGRISLELSIQEVPPSLSIPPFIIQPLIENSLKHGLKGSVEGSRICVSIKEYAEYMLLTVTDNGDGAVPDLLQQILDGRIPGIGIRNIYERLHLLYPQKDVMEVWTAPGKGTSVRIKLYKENIHECINCGG